MMVSLREEIKSETIKKTMGKNSLSFQRSHFNSRIIKKRNMERPMIAYIQENVFKKNTYLKI